MNPRPIPSAIENDSGMAQRGYDSRCTFTDIAPFNVGKTAGHQAGDEKQRGSRCISRYALRERCKEQAGEE